MVPRTGRLHLTETSTREQCQCSHDAQHVMLCCFLLCGFFSAVLSGSQKRCLEQLPTGCSVKCQPACSPSVPCTQTLARCGTIQHTCLCWLGQQWCAHSVYRRPWIIHVRDYAISGRSASAFHKCTMITGIQSPHNTLMYKTSGQVMYNERSAEFSLTQRLKTLTYYT